MLESLIITASILQWISRLISNYNAINAIAQTNVILKYLKYLSRFFTICSRDEEPAPSKRALFTTKKFCIHLQVETMSVE